MKKLFIGLLLCATMGSCGTKTVWVHSTKGQMEFEYDRDNCMAEGQRQAMLEDCRKFHCSRELTQASTFERCMTDHGWTTKKAN